MSEETEARIKALEEAIANLKTPHPSGTDALIIHVALILLALFSGTLVYRVIVRAESVGITEWGAIAVAVVLLRTDKASSAEISSGLLRRVLGVPDA